MGLYAREKRYEIYKICTVYREVAIINQKVRNWLTKSFHLKDRSSEEKFKLSRPSDFADEAL